jgi:hypothetical protein
VASLADSDAERLLRFVADAESIGGGQPFTPELLVELGLLIEADWVTYHEVDHVRRRLLFYILRPGDDDEDDDATDDDWDWERMNEHPSAAGGGKRGASALSGCRTWSPRESSAEAVTTRSPSPLGASNTS